MKAVKEFKKGQEVIYFGDWNRKGTWFYIRAVVRSCGEKQMTLLNAETGEMLGRNFRPDSSKTYANTYNGKTSINNWTNFTMATMSDEQAEEVCKEAARVQIADLHEHYAERISNANGGKMYIAAMEKNRDEITEPRALKR